MRFWFVVLLLCSSTIAAEEAAKPDYVRFVEDGKGASLDTAITSFTSAEGVTVDLVGAVHIADAGYYEALNEKFIGYDAVLYELVGGPMPKKGDIRERPRDPKLMWISELHKRMQTTLELHSQLEDINYQAPNFVHADMTVEEFNAAKAQKNESFLGLLVKAYFMQSELANSADAPASPGLVKLLEILCRNDGAVELKRLIGREFDSMETLMAGLEAGGGTVIVTERNKVAFKVMDEAIKKGGKRIAIFYGAAHLPSMEGMLSKRGFSEGKTEWVRAWILPPETKFAEKVRSDSVPQK